MITQERLKEVLRYDAETGEFIWRCNSQRAGTLTNCGYIAIMIDYKQYKAHRLAWLYIHGYIPVKLDHKDRNRRNNKMTNLRCATDSQNGANAIRPVNNTSGFKGVSFDKSTGKWMVYIMKNRIQRALGRYDTAELAAAAYERAASSLFAEFAYVGQEIVT